MSIEIWPKNREPYHGDIQQGSLGNCFLIAALQSIASCRPQLLKKIIGTSPLKCFFYRQGEKIEVPVHFEPITDEYQYCRSTNEHVHWPYIIEQGYARFYGGRFENLSGGNTSESFYDLLGLPVDEFQPNDIGLLDKIEKGFKDKHILVTAGFIDVSNQDRTMPTSILPNGIRKNHAYSILTTFYHQPTREKYILIHNPHGINHLNKENQRVRQAFSSNISRQHPLWSNTPGTQLLSWSEARTCFTRIQICYLNTESKRVLSGQWSTLTCGGCSNFPSFFKNPFILLPSTFPKKASIILGHKEDQRAERAEATIKLDYSQIGVTFVRLKTNQILTQDNVEVLKQSKFWNKREMNFELDFDRQQNRQYALVFSTYNPNIIDQFWLEIFSQETCPNIELKTVHRQYQQTIQGEWILSNAGGRQVKSTGERFYENPAYLFSLSVDSNICFILQQNFETFVPFEQNHPIGIYILPSQTNEEPSFIKARSISLTKNLQAGQEYYLIPTCYEQNSLGKYQIDILCDHPFNIDQIERKYPVPTPLPSPESDKDSDKQQNSSQTTSSMTNRQKPILKNSTDRSNSVTKKNPLSLAPNHASRIAQSYKDLE